MNISRKPLSGRRPLWAIAVGCCSSWFGAQITLLSMTVQNCAMLPVEKCAIVVGFELTCRAGRCRL